MTLLSSLKCRLGLGTVEIGLPYGLGVTDIPSEEQAERILKTAVDIGITYIDTARGYGLAEERIGKFGISQLPGVIVGTKCAQFLEKGEYPRGADLEKRIREEIEKSRKNLRLDTLPLVQLHGPSAEQIKRGELNTIMQTLQAEGKVGHIGIATRGEDAPLAGITSGFFKTIQTAYSILDQRMSPNVLPKAAGHAVGIINRSVLLKGVLTPKRTYLAAPLAVLQEQAKQANLIAGELGISLPALAIRFALSHPAISVILLGTVNPKNLHAAFEATQQGPLPAEVLERLYPLAISDPNLVDPAKWPK